MEKDWDYKAQEWKPGWRNPGLKPYFQALVGRKEIEGPRHGVTGLAKGIAYTGPKNLVIGLGNTIAHPIKTVQGAAAFIARPADDVFGDILDSVSDDLSSGEGIGRLAFDQVVAPEVGRFTLAGGSKALNAASRLELRFDRATMSSGGLGGVSIRMRQLELPFMSGAQRNVAVAAFPADPADLLPEIARNARGQILPSDFIRIRPEQHALQPGEIFAPRHHGQHYHVEIRIDPAKSWNNPKNVIKIKPPGYTPGEGTGFLPGEPLPGK